MKSNVRKRRVVCALAGALATAGLAGCATPSTPGESAAEAAPAETAMPATPAPATAAPTSATDPSAMVATSFGKGTWSDGKTAWVGFMFDAELDAAGRAKGFFQHKGSYGEDRIDLGGDVTCAGFDHPEGRAWIAGVVTSNDSTAAIASPDALPVKGIVGFVVEDASVALAEHIQFPQRLESDKAARAFCESRVWPADGVYPLTNGTLGVFP